nr:MAG TPA: hypothetical protein [Caudoviricetes sp.]DAS09529.1 MAG TPA: hypothetical protein [Caudoviricetes sp.]DAS45738.1 MAG TPA: hypothetical protein [Caudoviricetes sp.]
MISSSICAKLSDKAISCICFLPSLFKKLKK